MSVYKVEICGVNTAKLPILKEEEKAALFARIKQGDMTARETYIKGNLRLVLSVIKRFSGNQENIDDLFQIGCIGLIKSIDNFDDTLGVKFSTYAVRIMTHVMACAILHSVISVMVLPAIQRNHLPNYLLLPESLFLSLIIHISPRQMLIPRFLL